MPNKLAQTGMLLTCVSKGPIQISGRITYFPAWSFRTLLHSLQANAGIVPWHRSRPLPARFSQVHYLCFHLVILRSCYIMSGGRMIDEWWTGLLWNKQSNLSTIPALAWRDWGQTTKIFYDSRCPDQDSSQTPPECQYKTL
jgi:hypothetical protein